MEIVRLSWLINRVVNTIRSWLDVHYLEAQDAHILNRVERFVESVAAEGSQITAKQLTNLVARRVCLLCCSAWMIHCAIV